MTSEAVNGHEVEIAIRSQISSDLDSTSESSKNRSRSSKFEISRTRRLCTEIAAATLRSSSERKSINLRFQVWAFRRFLRLAFHQDYVGDPTMSMFASAALKHFTFRESGNFPLKVILSEFNNSE